MDLEIIILSEISLERERQIPHDITYMWNLKYDKNAKQKQIHGYGTQICGC